MAVTADVLHQKLVDLESDVRQTQLVVATNRVWVEAMIDTLEKSQTTLAQALHENTRVIADISVDIKAAKKSVGIFGAIGGLVGFAWVVVEAAMALRPFFLH
jgi:hypothetical protein